MSPTGVTYYESGAEFVVLFAITFPSPTEVTYYESNYWECGISDFGEFPSPTGVTYYELVDTH